MKKMMMFLMVSVFFLVGGMTDSKAQKAEPGIVQTPTSILARPGETVRIAYSIYGVDVHNYNFFFLYVQKPGQSLELLVVISWKGLIIYRNPAYASRISASGDMIGGVVTISNVRVEDTGDYYIAMGDSYNVLYFSRGTRLTVSMEPFIPNKIAIRKVSTSTKK